MAKVRSLPDKLLPSIPDHEGVSLQTKRPLSHRLVADLIAMLEPDSTKPTELDWKPRPKQLPPAGDWQVWLIRAGRGWGKTRTAAEYIVSQVRRGARRVHIIGQTAGDVRDVMVEGPSGLIACSPVGFKPVYEPSKRRVRWPNGAIATTFTAEKPQQVRGPECELLWADEIDHWKYPETWDLAMLGLRKGPHPRAVATSTPKPTGLVRKLSRQPGVIVIDGSTFENSENLAESFLTQIVARYKGTRLERQEIYGEILDAAEGALWGPELLDRQRVSERGYPVKVVMVDGQEREVADFIRVVIAVDPAVTSGEDSDETGIIVAGLGGDNRIYIVADETCRLAPHLWAARVARLYDEWKADRVIGEVNNGGDLVETVLRAAAPNLSYKTVRATRGKRLRAEPIAALYEQRRVLHCGIFPMLEEQMCSWTPEVTDYSPDRLDALVYAVQELALGYGHAYKLIGRIGRSRKVA